MQDVLDQAKRLADLIQDHERARTFREAAAAVEADPVARKVQETYATVVEQIHRLEEEGRPIEPAQKRAAAEAAEAVRASPILLRMLRAHAAYAEMMDAVQHVLMGGSLEEEGAEHVHGPGCSHEEGEGASHDDAPPAGREGPILWTP
jgi:cell fate (sporulation/competence/biofilm development) regulator YlbF (YheA/YmcA/DUF963 family)